MNQHPDIRQSQPQDREAIEAIYPAAFPEEDLLPLIGKLLGADVLSLVAMSGSTLSGHAIFSSCGLEGQTVNLALLGPLAVAPDRQRQGIGGALIRTGLQQLQGSGNALVCVLGDPEYYRRFGFAREADVAPPYPLPKEWDGAWQSLRLKDNAAPLKGVLTVPAPWQDPALWGP